jgi:hemerythrin
MQKYAQLHFETEERLLAEHNYPTLDAHAEKHREFERKTDTFLKAIRLPVDDVPDTLLVFLRFWWIDHILVEDMKYKYFFQDIEKR